MSKDKRLSISDLERIAERVLKLSDADETEVDVGATTDALTRFANNTIHQNVAEETLGISIRTVVDGRTARSTTNKTDDDSLRRAIAVAISLAKNQPKNPDLLPMLKKQKYEKVSRFFSATARTTPQDRARAVARVCKMADKRKQTAAGIFSSGASHSVLANSKGLFAHYEQTRSEFSVTILESQSSGWAKENSPDIREIDPEALAESASDKAAESREPREVPAGRYTTILPPSAVLDLVGFLFYDFAGTAVLDKRSCFTGRMGKKILGENITLWDDAHHPLQTGFPYDGEGVPRQKVLLVDKGVPKNLVYARATAKKMKA
ncbi:MAG: TldD/PmbA family protein, partial [Candidatus Acidiferrales bacterium]